MNRKLGQMPGIFDILSLLGTQVAEGSIFPADNEDRTTFGNRKAAFTQMPELCFQYWPDSVNDSKEIGWEFDNIPGGSHPIAKWISGGQRTISFKCAFTSDTDPNVSVVDLATGNVPEATVLDPYNNIDLRSVVKWLRWYTYPIYDDLGIPKPPPRLHLVLPGTQLAWDGSDDILCVMTGCDIVYKNWFSSGIPKMIEADLSFSEVVQFASTDGSVAFHARNQPLIAAEVDPTKKGLPNAAVGPGDYIKTPRKVIFGRGGR